jgi:hypothetical protein
MAARGERRWPRVGRADGRLWGEPMAVGGASSSVHIGDKVIKPLSMAV